jgi:hypothetical protein
VHTDVAEEVEREGQPPQTRSRIFVRVRHRERIPKLDKLLAQHGLAQQRGGH